MTTDMSAPRVAILGDSVIAGLGVRPESSYAQLVCRELGALDVLSLARSTMTVDQVLALQPQVVAFAPDLVLVSVGGADALVHPGKAIERALDRFGPASWKGVAGLEPRVRFTRTSRRRRASQRATSAVKVTVKRIGIAMTGGYRRVEPQLFQEHLDQLLQGLCSTTAQIIFISPGTCDARLFPKSDISLLEYRAIVAEACARAPGVVLVDPLPLLEEWSDYAADHAHYGERGHAKVAGAVLQAISAQRAGKPA